MSALSRRGFFGRLAAVAVGAVAAAQAKRINWYPARVAHDRETGISVRFLKEYDHNYSHMVSKLDVLFGTPDTYVSFDA